MDMREEYAAWARLVKERVDERQEVLDLGLVRRCTINLDGRQDLAGEESQDPGGWDAA